MDYLKGIGFSNYRSIGEKPVLLYPFSQVNLFVGPNNSGKSNILNRIYNWSINDTEYENVDYPKYNNQAESEVFFPITDEERTVFKSISHGHENTIRDLLAIFDTDSFYYNGKQNVSWFSNKNLEESKLDKSIKSISAYELRDLALDYAHSTNGYKQNTNAVNIYNKFFDNIRKSNNQFISGKAVYIHANRDLHDNTKNTFLDEETIISRLNHIINTTPGDIDSGKKKEYLENFISDLLGRKVRVSLTAENNDITIQDYDDRSGKTQRGLGQLGSGIHEIIYFAIVASLFDKYIICIDEPEIHMHPGLQRKFLNYICDKTNNQYFIATHSPAFINSDNENVSVFSVSINENGCTECNYVANEEDLFQLVELIGARASDVIQSNCIIWVEGPSDRIYLNYWIKGKNPGLKEGIQYSIMFYGGRLASHLTGEITKNEESFINLMRINTHSYIVIDSDKSKRIDSINSTKLRLVGEFGDNSWVTCGREIENYLSYEQYKTVLLEINSDFVPAKNGCFLKRLNKKNKSVNKVEFAEKYTSEEKSCDYSVMDLSDQIDKIIRFIVNANK